MEIANSMLVKYLNFQYGLNPSVILDEKRKIERESIERKLYGRIKLYRRIVSVQSLKKK